MLKRGGVTAFFLGPCACDARAGIAFESELQ
jgi:hypothetical protein